MYRIPFLAVLLLVSGFRFGNQSALFGLDIVICAVGAFTIAKLASSTRVIIPRTIVIIAISIGCFFCLDQINLVPIDYTVRGLARNTVFLLSVSSGYWFSKKPETRRLLYTSMMCSYLSFTLHYLLSELPLGEQYENIVKFGFGYMTLVLPAFLLKRWSTTASVLTSVAGLAMIVQFDTRSFGALALLASTLSIVLNQKRLSPSTRLWVLSIGTLLSIIAVLYLFEQGGLDSTGERRSLADQSRIDQFWFTVEGISKSPWFGYGSWQNAVTFVSQIETEQPSFEGVHSWNLQLFYEYGVLGFLYSIIISIPLFLFLMRIVTNRIGSDFAPWERLFWLLSLLFSIYLVIMGPFNGIARVYQGLLIGVALASNGSTRRNEVRKST